MEQWKVISNYDNYEVSNYGNVRNKATKRILKPSLSGKGYSAVHLYNNSGNKTIKIHKLVAQEFLNHFTDGTHNVVIDHIDGNKLNNHINNLQLISNRKNLSKETRGTSKYTGVSFDKKLNKWRAQIYKNKVINLGRFENEEDANNAYQQALKG